MGYSYLEKFTKTDGTDGVRYCEKDNADYVLVPINEFNGLKKAVRIVNDRALQQIDKSKTDEHGFRLLRADLKRYQHGSDGRLWLITKETPYSSKMAVDEASALIENKLRELYWWVDEVNLQNFTDDRLDVWRTRLTSEDLGTAREQWHDAERREQYNFLIENSERGRAVYQCFCKHNAMILEVSKLSVNYAQGLYEVTYWATEII